MLRCKRCNGPRDRETGCECQGYATVAAPQPQPPPTHETTVAAVAERWKGVLAKLHDDPPTFEMRARAWLASEGPLALCPATKDPRDSLAALLATVAAEARAAALEDDELSALRARMAKGRAKYPNGCTILSLLDEAGEFAHAVNKGEPVDRVRDELLDVAAVAIRLYLGEVDTVHDVVQRTQVALASGRGTT